MPRYMDAQRWPDNKAVIILHVRQRCWPLCTVLSVAYYYVYMYASARHYNACYALCIVLCVCACVCVAVIGKLVDRFQLATLRSHYNTPAGGRGIRPTNCCCPVLAGNTLCWFY